jgi:hypothetical protein
VTGTPSFARRSYTLRFLAPDASMGARGGGNPFSPSLGRKGSPGGWGLSGREAGGVGCSRLPECKSKGGIELVLSGRDDSLNKGDAPSRREHNPLIIGTRGLTKLHLVSLKTTG